MNSTEPTRVCIMNSLLQLPQKNEIAKSLVFTYKTKITGTITWKAKMLRQLNPVIVTHAKWYLEVVTVS